MAPWLARVSVAALAAWHAGAATPRDARSAALTTDGVRAGGTVVSELRNRRDVQFDLALEVGGQVVHVAPDTGSFALLLASSRCRTPGCPPSAFNPGASSSFRALNTAANLSFGSGNLSGQAADDEVSLPSLGTQRLAFWEVTRLDPRMAGLWGEAAFDGILGLPHRADPAEPASAGRPTFLEAFGIEAFTVCLGRAGRWSSAELSGAVREVVPHTGAQGTPSSIRWRAAGAGAENPGAHAAMTYLEVVGSERWAVNLTRVALRPHRGGPERDVLSGVSAVALIDTGTSTIQAPRGHLRGLRRAMGAVDWDCANVGELPDLVLRLGSEADGLEVVLPPSAYVRRLRHRRLAADARAAPADEVCSSRLAENSVASGGRGGPPVWVLGVPFLQEYMCEFDRGAGRPRVGVVKHPGVCSAGGLSPPLALGAALSSSRSAARGPLSGDAAHADAAIPEAIPDVRDLTGARPGAAP